MSSKSQATQDSLEHQIKPTPPTDSSLVSEERADPNFSIAPDGGLHAWLVAAGAACIFFSCLGFANSFGVLQEYYMSHQLQGHSADSIAWIGSVATFIQFAAGALSGPLFDRYGSWVRTQITTVHFLLTQH